jgi:hypothetical protein
MLKINRGIVLSLMASAHAGVKVCKAYSNATHTLGTIGQKHGRPVEEQKVSVVGCSNEAIGYS